MKSRKLLHFPPERSADPETLPSRQETADSPAIAGRVFDTTGTPVAGARVRLDGPGQNVGTSDVDGVFAFGHLAPGTYALEVEAEGYSCHRTGSFDLTGKLDGVVIILDPGAPFSGRIIGLAAATVARLEMGVSSRAAVRPLSAIHRPRGSERRRTSRGRSSSPRRATIRNHRSGQGKPWRTPANPRDSRLRNGVPPDFLRRVALPGYSHR